MLKFAKRCFNNINNSEKHFFAEPLGKGIYLFNMNRPQQRNALSRLLIDQFQEAMQEHSKA